MREDKRGCQLEVIGTGEGGGNKGEGKEEGSGGENEGRWEATVGIVLGFYEDWH